MKIITEKKQKELDKMAIKKLRFVARATLKNVIGLKKSEKKCICGLCGQDLVEENIKVAEDMAEQVFYADNVI